MTGYKIPEGWAIGWRNAIERYPKDSEYAWGMNAVLESIEALPLEELDENPWHTGTPTEECYYLCWIAYPECVEEDYGYWRCKYKDNKWYDDEITNDTLESLEFTVIAWQKIEPYKEKEDGHTD